MASLEQFFIRARKVLTEVISQPLPDADIEYFSFCYIDKVICCLTFVQLNLGELQ